jgi:hypothetical protein
MKTIKLAEWCEKTGVNYLTAWRWFKNKKMPVHAYQTESGTILVEDSGDIESAANSQQNDAMSLFLKKTVEYSKDEATIEDFAAYILSTFVLKINTGSEAPKYSKIKPKSEDIQNHFKKFIPAKGEKPKPNMFVAAEDVLDKLVNESDQSLQEDLAGVPVLNYNGIPTMIINDSDVGATNGSFKINSLVGDMSSVLYAAQSDNNKMYGAVSSEGLINRNVESPQQINYTSSIGSSFGSSFTCETDNIGSSDFYNFNNIEVNSSAPEPYINPFTNPFTLTSKEVSGANQILKEGSLKAKRGRPRKIR